jgi:hypothetical protein
MKNGWAPRGHVYQVEPLGDYQPDANVYERPKIVNNKMQGLYRQGQTNSGAMSYETPHPLRIVRQVEQEREA